MYQRCSQVFSDIHFKDPAVCDGPRPLLSMSDERKTTFCIIRLPAVRFCTRNKDLLGQYVFGIEHSRTLDAQNRQFSFS